MLTAATALVAVLFVLLAVTRRHGGAALGVLIAAMLLWPEAWRIPLGLLQMSVPRLVAVVLLVQFLITGQHARLRFSRIDGLVILIWVWTVFANVAVGAEFSQVSEMIGRGFDTALMYFVARLALLDTKDLPSMMPGLVATAVIMAATGIYEAISFTSPFHDVLASRLQDGLSWRDGYDTSRLGLMRARGSTSVSIFFGMAMVVVVGFLIATRGYALRKTLHWLALLAGLLAVLSTLSSGPWLAVFILIGLQVYEKRAQWIKPSLQLALVLVIAAEIASNRHFYELIDHLALNSDTAWYRTRLIEVAVSQWRDYWLLGVGSNWPNHWATLVDGRGHIDVVNHFITVALNGGLPAMVMYILSHVFVMAAVIKSWQAANDAVYRSVLFALASTLLVLDLSSMSVGLFGPPLLLSHILLGAMASVSNWDVRPHQNRPALGDANAISPRSPLFGHRYVD
ncbi:MAG: O-antigen ligase family protein [Marinobacter sp.]